MWQMLLIPLSIVLLVSTLLPPCAIQRDQRNLHAGSMD